MDRTLHSVAIRQGLGPVIKLLELEEQNIDVCVKALYRCRLAGYSVLVRQGKILVNGRNVDFEELTNIEKLLKSLEG
jgi:hypothetical protein